MRPSWRRNGAPQPAYSPSRRVSFTRDAEMTARHSANRGVPPPPLPPPPPPPQRGSRGPYDFDNNTFYEHDDGFERPPAHSPLLHLPPRHSPPRGALVGFGANVSIPVPPPPPPPPRSPYAPVMAYSHVPTPTAAQRRPPRRSPAMYWSDAEEEDLSVYL